MYTNIVKSFASNLFVVGLVPKLQTPALRTIFSAPLLQTVAKTSSYESAVTFKERTKRYFLSNLDNQSMQYLKPELSYSKLKELKKRLSSTSVHNIHLPLNETLQLFQSICSEDQINVLSLDKLAVNKLSECTKSNLTLLSLAAFKALGIHFTEGEFYSRLMQQIEEHIDSNDSHEDLVAWTFVCTLSKSQKGSSFLILRKIYERFKCQVEMFKVLSPVEISILCNAWFANGIFVCSKPMLRFIDATLTKEINSNKGKISQDSLPMLKVLRKACFASNELLLFLANTVSSPLFPHLNLAESTHALALLADHRYPLSDEMIENLTKLVLSNTRKPIQGPKEKNYHPTRRTRIKDITRFMWVASCLTPYHHPSCKRIAADAVNMLDTAWEAGSFRLDNDCHLLSDFFLSLACWNIYPEDIIKKIVTQEFVDTVVKQRQTVRQSRLALFLVAAHIEASHLKLPVSFFSKASAGLPPHKMDKELGRRAVLVRFAGLIDRSRDHFGWTGIKCGSVIPHLNIAGLTFEYNKQKIAVEILDSQVCMRHTSQPERLLAFKIRLLEKQGYRVYQLRSNQANCRQREAEVQDDNYIDQHLLDFIEWLKKE